MFHVQLQAPYGVLIDSITTTQPELAARWMAKAIQAGGDKAFVPVLFNGIEITPRQLRDAANGARA